MAGTHIGGETKLWTRGSSRPEARPSLPRVCVRVVRSHLLLFFFRIPSLSHTHSYSHTHTFSCHVGFIRRRPLGYRRPSSRSTTHQPSRWRYLIDYPPPADASPDLLMMVRVDVFSLLPHAGVCFDDESGLPPPLNIFSGGVVCVCDVTL